MDHQIHEDERYYAAPVSIPTGTGESTRLLQPPNPSPTKWYSNFMQNCRASPSDNGFNNVGPYCSERQSDKFLSCSPMVSGLRTLHLPNLELRDAAALAASRALRGIPETRSVGESLKHRSVEKNEGRKRSKSLGSERERFGNLDRAAIAARITPLYRDEMGRVSSGLSLCFVDNEHDVNSYGAIGFDELQSQDDNVTKSALKSSQSCTICNLGVESPRSTSSTTTPEQSPNKTVDEEKKEQSTLFDPIDDQSPQSPLISLLYGLVNSSIILPILMSFGSIIYHDDFFRPYLSILMKLTVLSGAVHQITFSTVSSLPFAVGQVQDAGLIFLSAMSRDLVNRLQSRGEEVEVVLATVCVGLSLATALLGGALILVGKWRLASYMQLLPSCVVGGYLVRVYCCSMIVLCFGVLTRMHLLFYTLLYYTTTPYQAYIGFFCGQAGLALMARKNVTGLGEWSKFFNHDAMIRIVPGLIGGSLIYYSVGKFRHMSVLPSCIVILMLTFYAILWVTGTTVQEATKNGWINESAKNQDWKDTWDFLRIDKVVWSVLPSQIGTLLAMISVVALSSSLDIAAIESKYPCLPFTHLLCNDIH